MQRSGTRTLLLFGGVFLHRFQQRLHRVFGRCGWCHAGAQGPRRRVQWVGGGAQGWGRSGRCQGVAWCRCLELEQLFQRLFTAAPDLRPGARDPDREMPILQGVGTRGGGVGANSCAAPDKGLCAGGSMPCATPSEVSREPMPMLPCVSEIQRAEHVVEPWTRGGEASRDFVRRQQWLKECK